MATDAPPDAACEPPRQLADDPAVIAEGLHGLENALGGPATQAMLAGFRVDFDLTHRRLTRLFTLHRLLVQLQELDELHDGMAVQVRMLTDGDDAWARLQLSVARAAEVNGRLVGDAIAAAWMHNEPLWVERLRLGSDVLPVAVREHDLETVEAIVDRERRAISMGESQTNARMLVLLEELLGSDLVAGFGAVLEALSGSGSDAVTVRRVADMLEALERVGSRMHALVSVCTGWRELLNELRYVLDQCRANGPENLDRAWVDVSVTGRSMLSLTDRAESVDALDAALQDALDRADFASAMAGFTDFFDRARLERRAADDRLHRAVGELEVVSAPLRRVVLALNARKSM